MPADRGDNGPPTELFTALYRRYRDVVKREAMLVCQNAADAEDVVHNVFMHLWESRSWATIRHPRAYLQGLARRAAANIEEDFEPLPDEFEVVDPSKGPFRLVVAGEARDVMLEALDALPLKCRRVMKLTLLEGRSTSQIAAEC